MCKGSSKIISRSDSNSENESRHGHVFSPASRSYFAWLEGKIDQGALNQRESGKFFPATSANLADSYAPDDMRNSCPPPDGKIASANQNTGQFLDEPGTHWQKNDVLAGDILTVTWTYSAKHSTRRWNYFITRENWDPNKPLSRAQFESTPFYQVQLPYRPYWEHSASLAPPEPTVHEMRLPKRSGYHVLLAIWEVADTGNAFYQIVDLNFVGNGGGEGPTMPSGLTASDVTTNSLVLTWSASPEVVAYRIYRNGQYFNQTNSNTWFDNGLTPDTDYEYAISAVDSENNESSLTAPLVVHTLAGNPGNPKPPVPTNLHSMRVSQSSCELMWSLPTNTDKVTNFAIHRDEDEVKIIPSEQFGYLDDSLKPSTTYKYVVYSLDSNGVRSDPSNELEVKTLDNETSGYPEWILNETYPTGAIVSYGGSNWVCLQGHTAYDPAWAPGLEGTQALWRSLG